MNNRLDISKLSSAQKRELLEQLLRERRDAPISLYPQSHGQRSLWFLYSLAPGNTAFNIWCAARVSHTVDVARLGSTLQALVDRHASLRTTYTTHNGQPFQRVHRDSRVDFKVVAGTGWSEADLARWREQEADRPFDLEGGPVLRVRLAERAEQKHVLLVTAHHIALDFWSLDLLLYELQVLYAAGNSGDSSPLPAPRLQYPDFVEREADMLTGKRGEELLSYWQEKLAGDLPVLHLPTDRPRPPVQRYRGTSHYFRFDPELTRRLAALASEGGATLYTTLLAGFLALLHRYTGQLDLMVGSPAIGRTGADAEDAVGYFVNPVVVRVDCSEDPTFRTFLGQVRNTVLEALEHQAYPFSLLVERLQPERDLSRSPLIQVLMAWDQRRFDDSAESQAGTGMLGLEVFSLGQGGAPYDLMLMINKHGDSLQAALQYNTDLFDERTIVSMERHFETLLREIVADPGRRLSTLSLLTDPERRRLLAESAGPRVKYTPEGCLHGLVEAQVGRTPDDVAIVLAGGGVPLQLTYRELDARSNQLARKLQTLGVGPGVLVAVCMERSLELAVALLGALKAGGAFVPVDPADPRRRLAFLLEDAEAQVVLTQAKFAQSLPDNGPHILCLDPSRNDLDTEPPTPPECLATPDDLAYVIYTSGSTGAPKGAMNTHAGICNRLLWMQERFRLEARDRVLQKTPHTFDVSVWEFFWPLLAGARLIVARPGVHADSTQLAETISNFGVTTVHFVPSMGRAFAADPAAEACLSLRRVFFSGEALTFDLQERFHARWPSVELHNLYGPTEAAIDVTHWACRKGGEDEVVPIGRPIANMQVYVLDEHLKPVPPGVSGELFIGGIGLALGYLNRPELTARRFLPNPFSDEPGARLYRTGDLGRYLPSGSIEFLGRRDQQVKVRGVRIEPSEVEQALREHPSVSDAAVLAREDGVPDGKRLVAYLTTGGAPPPASDVLRRFLATRLPEALIPTAFVTLDELPLTSSGKLDRRALPAPGPERPRLETVFVAPRNQVEKVLAEIWSEVLGLRQLGVHDSFFDVGGASIQSLEVARRANAAGLALTPASLFQYETIAALAAEFGKGLESHGLQVAADARDGGGGVVAADAAPVAGRTPSGDGRSNNTLIESLGVYLPERAVTTEEVLRGCRRAVTMPLERLTGIRSRRVAGNGEYSIDLARKAAEDCLARSRSTAESIDVLICCNISRCDGPEHRFYFEPSTAIRLKRDLGVLNALAFDLSNACAGMFTGILVADAFLRTGFAARVMVVSGEYITHLTRTAQMEIESFMDPRLACLTLGDAGAAVILERSGVEGAGFHSLELFTLSRYSSLCVAKATDQAHGGAIMLTDSIKQTAIAVREAVSHATGMMDRHGWTPEDVQHLIMHQTSATTINDAVQAINRVFARPVAHDGNTICNLGERGNTASTSHFVALRDHIANNRIRSGDRVFFGITGSGQTIGGALYTFDDLPDRFRAHEADGHERRRSLGRPPPEPARRAPRRRVRVESAAETSSGGDAGRGAVALAASAAGVCLERAALDKRELDVVLHAGVYREEFLSEPAIATLVAGKLEINDHFHAAGARQTLAFDVLSGGCGLLKACHLATQLIDSHRASSALVTAAEIENNRGCGSHRLRGIREMGSAVILREAEADGPGFCGFLFEDYTEHLDALSAYTSLDNGRTYLEFRHAPDLELRFVECAARTAHRLLSREGLDIGQVDLVLPPQVSPGLSNHLAAALGIDRGRIVDVPHDTTDWFTSSFASTYCRVLSEGLATSDDLGLVIAVGAGIQVGCSLYRF